MPAYRFEALDASCKTTSGLVDADTSRAARSQLRAQSLVPLAVTQVESGGTKVGGFDLSRKVFNATALAVWTRQLAGLVGSGLPLERALTALADEAEDARQRDLVAHLRSEVNSGSPFARALATMPREFDDVYRGVVAAGEQSGALGLVLERLADDLEARQELKGRLIGATLYPAIVSVIAVAIVVFLVTYVVPQVATVFTSTKRSLPLLTIAMMAFSDFLRSYGWLVLLALAAGGCLLTLMLRNEPFRERFDAGWLGLPLIGRLARGYNAARLRAPGPARPSRRRAWRGWRASRPRPVAPSGSARPRPRASPGCRRSAPRCSRGPAGRSAAG
jgi:general secretion pathway protein F